MGDRVAVERYEQAIAAIASRDFPLAALHTHRITISQAETAIRTLGGETGAGPALGVLVTA